MKIRWNGSPPISAPLRLLTILSAARELSSWTRQKIASGSEAVPAQMVQQSDLAQPSATASRCIALTVPHVAQQRAPTASPVASAAAGEASPGKDLKQSWHVPRPSAFADEMTHCDRCRYEEAMISMDNEIAELLRVSWAALHRHTICVASHVDSLH